MLGTEADTTTLLAPAGFCPRCDYRTDIGTCSECGLEIGELQLRRRPKPWWHRHWRRIAVALCVLWALTWFANARIDWIRLLPTSYLLSIQASESGSNEAATEELTRRYIAGSLSSEQTWSFIQACVEIGWSYKHYENVSPLLPADRRVHHYILKNHVSPPPLPPLAKLPPFTIEEILISIRADGREVPIDEVYGTVTATADQMPLIAFLFSDRAGEVPIRLRPNSGLLFRSCFINFMNFEAACRTIEIDTMVVVSDHVTGQLLAEWAMTHTARPKVPPAARAWEPVMHSP